jgi:hypothetical protein
VYVRHLVSYIAIFSFFECDGRQSEIEFNCREQQAGALMQFARLIHPPRQNYHSSSVMFARSSALRLVPLVCLLPLEARFIMQAC